ncbi:ATP-binding Cassette (ABC) Superfamily [Thraustotheca clavata]|uniref:ATP-binding Cassette (ABC) Superfamily n=1 Tax=Thraustotheca clavata TaxID=74557 RepID=A0A1V9YRY9_9STRA|nr:ATP-binding Cassette (ABC) Superfamily [Thraustotheca clavata]
MRQIIVLDPNSEAAVRVQKLISAWNTKESQHYQAIDITSVSSEAEDIVYESTHLGSTGQLRVLIKRNFTRLLRDKMTFNARVAHSIVISVFVGLIFFQLELKQAGIQSFTGAIFFIVLDQFMSAANPEFVAVPLEMPIMTREYNSGLYHSWVWYLAKNLSELGFQAFYPLLFFIPLYFMVGFGPSNPKLFFSMYLFLILTQSCATGLGYMVSCVSSRAALTPIFGIMTILPLLMFGGLFLNASMVPVYFTWLEFLSPIKYGFRGACREFWSSIDSIPCGANEVCSARTGQEVLQNLAMDKGSLSSDAAFLVWINILFRLIGIVALYLRIRVKH